MENKGSRTGDRITNHEIQTGASVIKSLVNDEAAVCIDRERSRAPSVIRASVADLEHAGIDRNAVGECIAGPRHEHVAGAVL